MKLIFSGGGTAGHVNPAINIANYVIQENKKHGIETEILFVGTNNGIESKLVPAAGFKLSFIEVEGLKRKLDVHNVKVVFKVLKSLHDSRKIMKSFKPDIVIGTGGYVCGPILYMASLMRIPTMIHEQNAYPGLTTKLLQKRVNTIFTGFPEGSKYLKAAKVIYTGNPVKKWFNTQIEKLEFKKGFCKHFGFRSDLPIILAFGGSLGAEKINNAVIELIRSYENRKFNILLISGTRFYEDLKDLKLEYDSFVIQPYLSDLSKYIAVSDLVISRAGAMTVSEIQTNNTSAILIPSPNVTNNHQEYNARSLEKIGNCRVILESELNYELLAKSIDVLLNDTKRSLSSVIIPETQKMIYQTIKEIIS